MPTVGRKWGEMLASAFAVTGFAVDNDLRVLAHSDVEGMDEIRVIDVKDMFWYLRGRAEGMSPFAVPSLLVCANALGLNLLKRKLILQVPTLRLR